MGLSKGVTRSSDYSSYRVYVGIMETEMETTISL